MLNLPPINLAIGQESAQSVDDRVVSPVIHDDRQFLRHVAASQPWECSWIRLNPTRIHRREQGDSEPSIDDL